jgi:hypothetical protein
MAQLGRHRLSKPYPCISLPAPARLSYFHTSRQNCHCRRPLAHPPIATVAALLPGRLPPILHQPLSPQPSSLPAHCRCRHPARPPTTTHPSPPAADRVPAICHHSEEEDNPPVIQRRRPPRPPLSRGGRPTCCLRSGHRCAAAALSHCHWCPWSTSGARPSCPSSFASEQPVWHPCSLLSLWLSSNSPSPFFICRHDSNNRTQGQGATSSLNDCSI